MPNYGEASYWDERYCSHNTTFDWFVSFDALRSIFEELVLPTHRVLVIGCGNSRLSAELYDNLGITNITNIDISGEVISQMKARYKEMDKMEWLTMDVLKLDFPAGTFDVVIDKGLIDSLLCGGNSFFNAYTMNKNISRVMKEGGTYIIVTYGQPETRMDHYRRSQLLFEVSHREVEKPVFASDASPTSVYHVYVAKRTKNPEGELDAQEDYDDEDDFYDKFQAMQS